MENVDAARIVLRFKHGSNCPSAPERYAPARDCATAAGCGSPMEKEPTASDGFRTPGCLDA